MKRFVIFVVVFLVIALSIFLYLYSNRISNAETKTLQIREVQTFLSPTVTTIPNNAEKREKSNFLLSIPKIDLSWEVRYLKENEVIEENWGIPPEILDDWGTVHYPRMDNSSVLYPKLVYPGEVGVTAIAGHRDISESPFLRLDELEAGDNIYIHLAGGEVIRYIVVASIEIDPNESQVFVPQTKGEELRLTTCPIGSTKKRFVVYALRVEY